MKQAENRYKNVVPEGGIAISQSLSKTLGYYVIEENIREKEICPRQIYYKDIVKEVEDSGSEAMQNGSYLEQETIGSTMTGEHVDMPKHKKTGKMRKTEERINIQAMRFPYLCNINEIRVTPEANTQVTIVKHIRGNYYAVGTLDLFPTTKRVVNKGESIIVPAIIDIKGAQDVHNDYVSENNIIKSNFCWGKPQYLNINQVLFYKWLTQNIDPELNKHLFNEYGWTESFLRDVNNIDFQFFFFVMGFGKDITDNDPQYKILRAKWNKTREQLVHDLIDNVILAYEYYQKEGWPANPGERCRKCPLSELQCIHKTNESVI